LAHDLIRLSGLVPHQDIPINIVGRRPGEKVKEDILSSTESDSAEKSGPFFMAPSQFVQMEALQNHLAALREAADEGDAGKIIGLIKDIVPEFLPDANQVAIAGNNGTGALHKITK
jgi:FlaA1/EpsC-like NDP-sugar epimerase